MRLNECRQARCTGHRWRRRYRPGDLPGVYRRGLSGPLTDVDEEGAATAAAEIDPSGDVAIGLKGDVSSTESVDSMVAETLERLGRLDALVNVAGVVGPGPSEELSDTEWDPSDQHPPRRSVPLLTGGVPGSRGVWRRLDREHLVDRRADGVPNRVSYCAAKAGIEGLTRALAVEWAKRGVRVNAVAPGHVRTPMLDYSLKIGSVTEEIVQARTNRIPMGRYAQPEEIAAAVLFLSSPAASYITGEVLCVDGAITVNADAP